MKKDLGEIGAELFTLHRFTKLELERHLRECSRSDASNLAARDFVRFVSNSALLKILSFADVDVAGVRSSLETLRDRCTDRIAGHVIPSNDEWVEVHRKLDVIAAHVSKLSSVPVPGRVVVDVTEELTQHNYDKRLSYEANDAGA